MRPDSGENTSSIPAIGSMYSPALSGESPRTFWRYSVVRNRNPPVAANENTAIALAPANGALRKNRISSSGSSRCSSYAISAAKHTAETANTARLEADVHPVRGPSMIA